MTDGELQGVLSRLQKVKKSGGGYVACCPVHEDRSPSLSLRLTGDGKLLLFCHAGCRYEEIRRALGLEEKQATAPSAAGRAKALSKQNISDLYDYLDEDGALLFQVVRRPDKSFGQRHRAKIGGAWVWGLSGVRRVPYRLPRVLAAIKAGQPVYLAEGEKDAHAIERMGATGSTTPMGTIKQEGEKGVQVWRDTYAGAFRGGDIRIVIDNDPEGEKHAKKVALALTGIAKSVQVLRPAAGKDAHDHAEAGHGLDDLKRDRSLEPDLGLPYIILSTVEAQEVQWLWHPYLPRGRGSLLEGDGDVGKSFMCCALTAGITRGQLPTGEECEPGTVLMLASEDEAGDTLRPRIEAFQGDLDKVAVIPDLFPLDPVGLTRLRHMVMDLRPVLTILDPFLAYIGAAVNINNANEVRPILDQMKRIASEAMCGWINIRHTGKTFEGKAAHHGGLGSVDIRNSHRSQMMVQWHPDTAGLRVVTHEKHNLSERGACFGFDFRGGQFGWLWDIEEPETFARTAKRQSEVDPRIEEATDLIFTLLSNGPALAKDFEEGRLAARIPERAWRRARARMAVVPYQEGGKWWVRLPDGYDPFADQEADRRPSYYWQD